MLGVGETFATEGNSLEEEERTHHVNMPNINDAPLHILQHHQIVLLVKNSL